MDIIVTSPKSRMAEAAAEAEDAKKHGGDTLYFRRFPVDSTPNVHPGDRIYYAEDGYVRGFGIVHRVLHQFEQTCDTTGQEYGEGHYVFHRADSWQWIRPVPYKGFQGYRYAPDELRRVAVVGGWLDPKPEVAP